jgi:hypothetical protein
MYIKIKTLYICWLASIFILLVQSFLHRDEIVTFTLFGIYILIFIIFGANNNLAGINQIRDYLNKFHKDKLPGKMEFTIYNIYYHQNFHDENLSLVQSEYRKLIHFMFIFIIASAVLFVICMLLTDLKIFNINEK